ncbi:MAG: T9SS type A sorting domain-containing protein [Bacteroidia bacterium]
MKTIYPAKLTGNWWKNLGLVLLIFCSFGINTSKASHMAGADLTYQSLGNGQYLVTYTLYRDCAGIDAPLSEFLNVSSTTCNSTQSYTLNQDPGTGQEITLNCPGVPSTCNGGTAPGIQAYSYSVVVTLPAQCPDWNFSVSDCCRNAAITTLDFGSGDNLYIEAYLNNMTVDNNSPTFSNYPVAFECIGQNNFYNHGVIDADGDSLVYSFIPPRTDANIPVTYATGYSIANPLTSSPAVSINSNTGDIQMHPTQTEVAVVAVLIQEYRNGVLIGSVMRDMQIYTVQCTNTLPTVSGINGTGNFVTSACVGGQLCFDVITGDPDANQNLTLTWNQGVPGATFTVTGPTNSPVGHFCWSPTPADARPQPYTFTVMVHDDACPSNGVATVSFSVTVSNMGLQVTSTPSVACNGMHNGSASVSASGNPPLSYLWSSSVLPAELTTSTINHLAAGVYTVNVTDGSGCVGSQTVTITEPQALNVSVTGVNAGCNATFGSATAVVTGGTPSYSYSWNTSPVQTSDVATDLSSGQYTVTVTDAHSCHTTGTVTINNTIPVSFSINSTPATCLANDGTATVTTTGGSGNFSYDWTPNVSSTSSATGLITGTYECIATDLTSGCSQTLTTYVANAAGISAEILAYYDATCGSSEDGGATVTITGGQPPYSILWPSGDTSASVSNLAPGTYTVMVEDYLGCRAYASVTIGAINPSPIVDLGPDTTACIGDQIVLDAGAGNSYLWSDNSTGQTLTVTTAGTYSVLVTNASGCQAFDAIAVDFISCNAIHSNNTNSVGAANELSIYPNPAHNNIHVNIAKIRNTQVLITVMDILGNQVYSVKDVADYGYSKVIDVNDLTPGVYTIKVEYNGDVKTSRIVKQ